MNNERIMDSIDNAVNKNREYRHRVNRSKKTNNKEKKVVRTTEYISKVADSEIKDAIDVIPSIQRAICYVRQDLPEDAKSTEFIPLILASLDKIRDLLRDVSDTDKD